MSRELKPDRTTLNDLPIADGDVGRALQGLIGAYNSIGYQQGYARAMQYLAGTLPVLIEQFDRDYVGVTERDREVLKLFGRFLEEKLGAASAEIDARSESSEQELLWR